MTMSQRADKKKMHLLGFLLNGMVSHMQGVWKHPRHHQNYPGGFARPEMWQDTGRILEQGKFDGLFLADVLAPYQNFGGNSDSTLRHAAQWPVHDPAAVVPIIACATERLGIGLTLSTSFVPPYHIARQLSTLEHLTQNRVGWNVVTSYSQADFQAMGMESMVAPDERYARAEEFIQICNELWDAYDDGAIVRDVETGVFADPAKVREVNFSGQYLRCKTRPHTLPLSPNRRPVIWQAGASPPGRAFAARHADAVFQVAPNAAAMRPYADDIRSRVENEGRDPNLIKIIFGAQTVVAESRAEAQEKHDELRDAMAMESVLTMMSGHMGPDFSTFDLDKDISEASTDPALQGVRSAVETILNLQDGDNDPITLRQVAYYYGMAVLTPILVGTAEDIADELEHLLDDGGGDGFMLFSTYVPDCYREFCDLVVPELQRRGRFREDYSGKTLRHHLTEY